MNCKELVYLLEDYFDGSMEEHLRQELSVHLELCEPCMNFLKTYDTTRILCRLITPEEIPQEVRDRLKAFVVQKAREHHKDIEKYLERASAERRAQVKELLRAYTANRLSPILSVLFRTHRDGCPKCGAFLEDLNGGKEPAEIPGDIEEHLSEFLDALPPGELPFLS